MTPTPAARQEAEQLWAKIWPRIQYMVDLENGTHAKLCLKDIADTLLAAEQRGRKQACQRPPSVKTQH